MTPRVPGGLPPLAAAADASPSTWLATLARRRPLVLAPDGARGWFRGRAIVAFDPVDGGTIVGNGPEALHAAGAVLERALSARDPLLAVVLLPYSGDVRWSVYERGLELDERGWHWWGSEPTGGWPHLEPMRASESQGAPAPAPPREPAESQIRAHAPLAHPLATSLDQPAFVAAVEATREAIMRGDVYVLNLTRTIEAQTELSAPELFAALTERAPATMAAAWLPGDGGTAIVSASPERFVRLTGHEIEIAPVKGTRGRGADAAEDSALVAELLESAKERAEHVMVVDLERNDIGRVCVPGSVRVDPLFEVETMSYCHQAVSSVRGLMQADASVGDLLEATFPCGSITGAPKIAAVRIAAELEHGERGAYTGSLVVAMPGELDSSVLIRTVELDGEKPPHRLRYGTGCGITVESDPQAEWEESVLKTRPLFGSPREAVALKETARVAAGRVPLWPYHRARLSAGGVAPELLAAIDARVAEAAADAGGAYAGDPGAAAGAAPAVGPAPARLTVVVNPDSTFAVAVDSQRSSLDVADGVIAARVDVASAPPIPLRPAKPADRSFWDTAHHEAVAAGAHQAVLVDGSGIVIDGSTSCVWIVEGGMLVTPPAPPAIPSVSNAFLAANAAGLGLAIRVEPFTWARFEAADEAFFTNAYGGAALVRGRGGAVFSAVEGLFAEVWGRDG